MKCFRLLFLLIFVLSGILYSQTELTIVYLNDTHSALAPLGPRNADLSGTQGGIARAASIIGYYENFVPNVLTLHSGDFSIGDFFFLIPFSDPTVPPNPQPELAILNQLGVDAFTLGNHEFDVGVQGLTYELGITYADPASAPFLSANATNVPDDLNAFVRPVIIRNFGSFKVGIFGLTTTSANSQSNPYPVYFSDEFKQIAEESIAALKTAGCDFIVCLSHLGLEEDTKLANEVENIDLIVGGHDHLQLEPLQINDTWIVQTEGYYRYIGTISFDLSGSKPVMIRNEMIQLDESIPEEPNTKAVVDAMIAGIEGAFGLPLYTQQIATSVQFMEDVATDVFKPGNHSTAAGNFVSNALKWRTGTDFAIEPGGSIALPVYQGPIVAADLFRTVGYGGEGFKVVTFELTGLQLYTALEMILTMIGNEDYMPQFSGLKLKYIPNAPEGQKVQSIMINNKPIDFSTNYSISSNELVTMMLVVMGVIEEGAWETMPYTEFQNLLAYVEFLKGKITPDREARIIAVQNKFHKDGEDLADIIYELKPNYPNPFNPSTTITFSLPVDNQVKLLVYNMLGEEVSVLVDEFKNAGEYSIVWDAENLPGGIYFLSLQNSEFNQTRKMVLLK